MPSGGLLDGTGSPDKAVKQFLEEYPNASPGDGYRRERTSGERVLYSFDVQGRSKVVIVVVNDRSPKTPMDGWGAESFAACDPSELPPSRDAEFDVQVWRDRTGQRVNTDVVTSYQGAEHCGWESVTFLQLGQTMYLRDPDGVFARGLVRTTYQDNSSLPGAAQDTGYHRAGQRVWVADDSAYIVTDTTVERWPGTTRIIGCK